MTFHIFVLAGGVHQGRAAQPEEGVPPRAGGGEAHPERPSRHRSVRKSF